MPALTAASLLAALLLAPPAYDLAATVRIERIRTESTDVRSLIDRTVARSPTVRELIARLGCTDVIVYVELTSSPGIPTARTKLVASVARARFVRIGINSAAGDRDRQALLAHELQHALEIAEHAEVRDDDGVRRLYRLIGESAGGDSYETDAARAVEWNVRSELRTKMGG